MELPDLRAAHNYALADARDVMQRDRSGSQDWALWTFEITNESGAYALTVPFSAARNGTGIGEGTKAA